MCAVAMAPRCLFFGGLSTLACCVEIPTKEITSGVHMPVMSIGDGGEQTDKAKVITSQWLSLGGRGIDTAYDYGNQGDVAQAIVDSGVNRDELFITTKIPGCDDAESYIQKDLQLLNTTYIDLLLIHFPDGDCTNGWATLEDFYDRGILKAIGVSHFNRSHIAALMKTAHVTPHVNQILLNVIEHDDDQINASLEQGMQVEAYCPLGRGGMTGDIPGNPIIQSIAAAHNVSTYQVAIRWILQSGYSLTFQSSKRSHQESDADVFSFELNNNEMNQLNGLHIGDGFHDGEALV